MSPNSMTIYEKYFSTLEIVGNFYPCKSTKKPTTYAILDEILLLPKNSPQSKNVFPTIIPHYTLKILTNATGQDTQVKSS